MTYLIFQLVFILLSFFLVSRVFLIENIVLKYILFLFFAVWLYFFVGGAASGIYFYNRLELSDRVRVVNFVECKHSKDNFNFAIQSMLVNRSLEQSQGVDHLVYFGRGAVELSSSELLFDIYQKGDKNYLIVWSGGDSFLGLRSGYVSIIGSLELCS